MPLASASCISVRCLSIPVVDWVHLFKYRTSSDIDLFVYSGTGETGCWPLRHLKSFRKMGRDIACTSKWRVWEGYTPYTAAAVVLLDIWCSKIITKCRKVWMPREKLVQHRHFLPIVNCFSPASAFRQQGQQAVTVGHRLVQHCSAMIVTFLLRKDWRTLFIKMWHNKKRHQLAATSTTPFPSLKIYPNTQQTYGWWKKSWW